jgi:hypothetical protein
LLLAKTFGTPAEVKKVQEIMKRNKKQGHTSKADNDWMYKNINKYYDKIRTEEVEVAEAVLADRDYEYDGKVIKISKKNFSKVHRDFKNSTKGQEMMMTYDDKAGTVSVPVEFTEEVEVDENFAVLNEALKPRDKAVIDAFYSRKGNLASNLLSVEGGKLTKMGMGGQEIAIWKNDKIVINAKMDVKSTEEIVRYMKKSIPSGVFEEVEIAEGWKAGKYTIKDDKGKILGTYSSGGKAQKAMNDLMQKGDYDKLEVAMVEEVAEAKGTAYPATIDTLKMIVREKQNQTVMFKSGQAIVDIFTASAMVAVYDAMKPATKKKFEKMIMDKGGFMKTQAFAMKMTEDAKWIDQIKEDPSMLELHYSLVEITEAVHDKKSTFTMAPFEDLRGVADVALKIMQRQPLEVKEEEQEVTSEETPQKLTE